jgi:MoxR-like ATPase
MASEKRSGGRNDVIEDFQETFYALREEIGRVIVGQKDIVDQVLTALFARGHVLLEGVPGLGKTLLVKSLSCALGFDFKRIQFTPDLMPADITGTQLVRDSANGMKTFEFSPGPIFTNIILADEINRATPRTQSALLEAMEERQVSVAGVTRKLEEPFFVLATQNPIEMEGTYPLPEAQVDRFLLKVFIDYPTAGDLHEILRRTTTAASYDIKPVLPEETASQKLRDMQQLVREVLISQEVERYIVGVVTATRPDIGRDNSRKVNRYVSYGSSPRGAQALVLCSKVAALLDGRANVSYEDVDRMIFPTLNHRMVLNFEAEADKMGAEDILREVREETRTAVSV